MQAGRDAQRGATVDFCRAFARGLLAATLGAALLFWPAEALPVLVPVPGMLLVFGPLGQGLQIGDAVST